MRTFGYFHPAAKLRLNRVRALLGQSPVLTAAEMQAWNPPPDPNEELVDDPTPCSPQPLGAAKPCADGSTLTRQLPQCPHCHKTMIRLGSWRTPQDLLRLFALWRTQRRADIHPP